MRRLALLVTLAAASPGTAADSPRPNVVVILADDLGYGDVKCLNADGKIPTPHLDRIAAAGIAFTDAHSGSAVCTPTRYGLLTGRYAWRTRLQNGVLGGLSPRLIEQGRPTLATLLKSVGYATACVGKWHLGMDWAVLPGKTVAPLSIETREQVFNVDYAQPIRNGPTAVGFDFYFGISASLDMVPYTFIRNDRVVANPTDDKQFLMRVDVPNRFTRLGPTAPGFKCEDVLPTLVNEAVTWIDHRSRTPATPFFLYLPLTTPHTPIAPSAGWLGKTGLGAYADFVAETDDAVGRVLAALERHGFDKNTQVIVTSDNGCSPEADFAGLLARGHNPSYRFRGHKADIYEGGHRVPFLVRWPGVVRPGRTSDQLTCLTDVFRTCADAAGVPVPATAGEDSFSFLPVLYGERSSALRTAIVNHSITGSFAIRDGPWKLCLCPGSGGWSTPRPGRDDASQLPPAQLFNLTDDLGETTNLHARHPEIVDRLTKLLDGYVAEGRSTPGTRQANAVAVDVWRAGRAAMLRPVKKK